MMSTTSTFSQRTALLLFAFVMVACAHQEPLKAPTPVMAPAPPPPPPPPPPEAKLVVFPLEIFALPNAAKRLNEKLAALKLENTSVAVLATLSMGTAQLQSECAEPTDYCFAKIATQMNADRILWVEAERVGKKKKKAPTTLKLALFDGRKGTVIARFEDTFTGPIPDESLDEFIGKFVGLIKPMSVEPPAASPGGTTPGRQE